VAPHPAPRATLSPRGCEKIQHRNTETQSTEAKPHKKLRWFQAFYIFIFFSVPLCLCVEVLSQRLRSRCVPLASVPGRETTPHASPAGRSRVHACGPNLIGISSGSHLATRKSRCVTFTAFRGRGSYPTVGQACYTPGRFCYTLAEGMSDRSQTTFRAFSSLKDVFLAQFRPAPCPGRAFQNYKCRSSKATADAVP
jgi:hypothetical protein